MSKMSQLHAELSEQASDLGFESIEEAEANGYHIGYTNTGWKLQLDMAKAQEKAHEAWLKEKQQVLDELTDATNDGELDWGEIVRKIEHAIEFIEEQCHD